MITTDIHVSFTHQPLTVNSRAFGAQWKWREAHDDSRVLLDWSEFEIYFRKIRKLSAALMQVSEEINIRAYVWILIFFLSKCGYTGLVHLVVECDKSLAAGLQKLHCIAAYILHFAHLHICARIYCFRRRNIIVILLSRNFRFDYHFMCRFLLPAEWNQTNYVFDASTDWCRLPLRALHARLCSQLSLLLFGEKKKWIEMFQWDRPRAGRAEMFSTLLQLKYGFTTICGSGVGKFGHFRNFQLRSLQIETFSRDLGPFSNDPMIRNHFRSPRRRQNQNFCGSTRKHCRRMWKNLFKIRDILWFGLPGVFIDWK